MQVRCNWVSTFKVRFLRNKSSCSRFLLRYLPPRIGHFNFPKRTLRLLSLRVPLSASLLFFDPPPGHDTLLLTHPHSLTTTLIVHLLLRPISHLYPLLCIHSFPFALLNISRGCHVKIRRV